MRILLVINKTYARCHTMNGNRRHYQNNNSNVVRRQTHIKMNNSAKKPYIAQVHKETMIKQKAKPKLNCIGGRTCIEQIPEQKFSRRDINIAIKLAKLCDHICVKECPICCELYMVKSHNHICAMMECPICYESDTVKSKNCLMLECGHNFCKTCLKNQLQSCINEHKSLTCAMCRRLVSDEILKTIDPEIWDYFQELFPDPWHSRSQEPYHDMSWYYWHSSSYVQYDWMDLERQNNTSATNLRNTLREQVRNGDELSTNRILYADIDSAIADSFSSDTMQMLETRSQQMIGRSERASSHAFNTQNATIITEPIDNLSPHQIPTGRAQSQPTSRIGSMENDVLNFYIDQQIGRLGLLRTASQTSWLNDVGIVNRIINTPYVSHFFTNLSNSTRLQYRSALENDAAFNITTNNREATAFDNLNDGLNFEDVSNS